MGVDLRLLPVECDRGDWGYSHTMLEIGRNYETHDLICATQPQPRDGFELSSYLARVPDGSRKGECCYGVVREDPYGHRITYISRENLIACLELTPDPLLEEQAALAYLRAAAHIKLVALYWH